MKTENTKTVVIFRTFKEGDVIALFPYEITSLKGECMSYQHIGQHSDADYYSCVKITKPANLKEYTPLLKELKSLGYNDLIIKRKINHTVFLQKLFALRKRYLNK